MRFQGRTNLVAIELVFQIFVLSTSAQVVVFPANAVAGLNSRTVFTCHNSLSLISNAEWLVNGTSLSELEFDNIQKHTVLQLRNITAELNYSVVQCLADSVLLSEDAVLLVQGLLDAVGSLLVNAGVDHIYVNWTAPFTLDISATTVDITYCVDVVSSTSSATLHSECGITETEFTYPLPHRVGCDEYNFTVTPVNTAGNGTSNVNFYHIPPGLEVVDSNVTTINTTTSFIFVMTSPVCYATVTFNSIYSDYQNNITVNDTQLTVSDTTISSSLDLTLNSLYKVILSASNVHDAVRSEKIISTYDVTNCLAYQFDGSIVILVNFVEHTEATGALLSFIHINENSTIDFNMSFSRVIEKNRDLQNATLSLNVSYPGNYVVYVYDIEHNKQIVDGLNYQATTCNFSVSADSQETTSSLPQQNDSCEVNDRKQIINVECQSLSKFQVTAQIHDSRKVNILHVNSSSQSLASVEVPENGEYLLTVLPIQDGRGILSDIVFSFVHTVTVTTTTLYLGPSSFTSSSRVPEVYVNSECTAQASALLLILLDIVFYFCS